MTNINNIIYPKITTIDIVLKAISKHPEFVVGERDGYNFIDYIISKPDSFDCEIRRECRGIKFDNSGFVLARPLHKFFNFEERQETRFSELSGAPVITKKLDGSMVHAVILNDDIRLMTRKGITEQSKKAEKLLLPIEKDFLFRLSSDDKTAIFEYISPNNKIIIDYPDDSLICIGIRDNITGEYLEIPDELESISIQNFLNYKDPHDFYNKQRSEVGHEGYILKYPNGVWIKCKNDDYVLRQTTLNEIQHEKNILKLILSKKTDDIYPLLNDSDVLRIKRYEKKVLKNIFNLSCDLESIVNENLGLDQKSFSLMIQNSYNKKLWGILFQIRGGRTALLCIQELLLKNCGSQSKLDSVRHLFDAELLKEVV